MEEDTKLSNIQNYGDMIRTVIAIQRACLLL